MEFGKNFFSKIFKRRPDSSSNLQRMPRGTVEPDLIDPHEIKDMITGLINKTKNEAHDQALADAIAITAAVSIRIHKEDTERGDEWKIPIRREETGKVLNELHHYLRTGESEHL